MGSLRGEDDIFFDTREDVTSVSNSSSDVEEKSDVESKVDGDASSNFGYEVWIKTPGTIVERRHRLLKLMGLSAEQIEKKTISHGISDCEVGMDGDGGVEDSGSALWGRLPTLHSSSQSSISCGSADSFELSGDEFDENSACKIKNLDSGAEFIVDELGKDGLLRKLRETSSGRSVSGEEFEKILGMPPLAPQMMQKNDGQAFAGDSLTRRRGKRGWFRRLRATSCVVDVRVGGNPFEPTGLSPLSKCGARPMRVRATKKHIKELSDLYRCQEFKAHRGAILTMKFSPDGMYLASAGEDRIVRVWMVNETERFRLIRISNMESSNVYFTVNDESELVPLNVDKERKSKLKRLVKSSEAACVIFPQKVFYLEEKPINEFHGHESEILDLSWSKDKHLISSSVDKTVRLWRVGVDECLRIFNHNNYVTCVQFNPMDDNHFISGSIDGKVRIWAIDGCEVVDWTDIKDIVTALCYQPDGQGVIVGSMAGDCIFFDTSDERLQSINKFCFEGKKRTMSKRITGFQFSPVDSSKLMVTSADSLVRILQGSEVIGKYRGLRNTGSQISASYTPDGAHIISASEDSNIYMWNLGDTDVSSSSPQRSDSNWSSERFISNNASVAIPWPGSLSRIQPIFPNVPGEATFKCSGTEVQYMPESSNIGGSSNHVCLEENPLSDKVCFGFSNPSFGKQMVSTWPEEKLPGFMPLVVSSSASEAEYKFVKCACQNMVSTQHAWGSVMVTAGWEGMIRVFQNYGLPVHV